MDAAIRELRRRLELDGCCPDVSLAPPGADEWTKQGIPRVSRGVPCRILPLPTACTGRAVADQRPRRQPDPTGEHHRRPGQAARLVSPPPTIAFICNTSRVANGSVWALS